MRIFASDLIKRVMGTFKIPEDEPIFNSMITRALEKAQTKIEELNFDARKHVLAYDDVLNIQRTSVYARRRALLTGDERAVDEELSRIVIDETAKNAVEAKKSELGDEFHPVVRRFLLQTIDFLWVEHLEAMEYLRSSVNLRAYGQRDPLVEYKKEGLHLFRAMEENYRTQIVHMLPNLVSSGSPAARASESLSTARAVHNAARAITASGPIPSAGKIGRNDRVTITDGVERREMKFKKAELLLKQGWKIVEK